MKSFIKFYTGWRFSKGNPQQNRHEYKVSITKSALCKGLIRQNIGSHSPRKKVLWGYAIWIHQWQPVFESLISSVFFPLSCMMKVENDVERQTPSNIQEHYMEICRRFLPLTLRCHHNNREPGRRTHTIGTVAGTVHFLVVIVSVAAPPPAQDYMRRVGKALHIQTYANNKKKLKGFVWYGMAKTLWALAVFGMTVESTAIIGLMGGRGERLNGKTSCSKLYFAWWFEAKIIFYMQKITSGSG